MSWRPSSANNKMNNAVAATLLFLVAAVMALLAVPCAGQQCLVGESVALSSVGTGGSTTVAPTVAQRVRIGGSSVFISQFYVTLFSYTNNTLEAQIRYDDGAGAPGVLVSKHYVANVTTYYNDASTYSMVFFNGTELTANAYYWVVFTTAAAVQPIWSTGPVQSSPQGVYNNEGFAYVATESIPSEQVASNWTTYPAGNVNLTFSINGCIGTAAPSASPTSSPASPSASPSASPQAPSASPQAPTSSPQAPSASPQAPSASPQAPTSSPTATRTPTQSSPTPQASASATPVVLVPITANVTSSFDSTQTALNLTAPASSGNGTSGSTQPGVTVVSQFSEVQLGNRTLPPPAIQALTVSNDTSTNATTYTYASQLENTTSVEQAFTFFDRKTSANFSGLTFDISASSVKWSIHLISNTSSSANNSTTSDGLTLRYRLTGLTVLNGGNSTTGGAALVASRGQVVVKRETPRANMTTYLVPLFTSSSTATAKSTTTTRTTAAQVELFDVALIDGTHFVPIGHSIVRTGDNERAEYVVELVLPGFNESLFYDPSIGLGVLLGRNGRDDGGGSTDSNVGLIVGVAVAIPVAIAVVLVVIGAALVIGWRKKRLTRYRGANSVNFSQDDQL